MNAPCDDRAADRATLQQLNDAYINAVATSDVAWFERHLSADFLNSNPDGTLSDRAAFLGQVARPSAVSGLRSQEVLIRVFGRTAIVHGRTDYRRADGTPGAGRYTDVWAREGDSWVCVAADVTRC